MKTISNMDNYSVYIHTNKINGKKYIGITSQRLARRWRNGNGYYQNEHFYRAICKYGWDNFTHEVIREGLTKEEACLLEKQLIAKYHTNEELHGYNKSTGGEFPVQGVKLSEETKRKMSESHKKIVFTEEWKKNMSIAAKKRGNMKTGKNGIQCGVAGLVKQIDIKSGEVVAEYYGFYEMSRKTGFGIEPVRRATRGKQKQSHGYKWEYTPRREINVIVR